MANTVMLLLNSGEQFQNMLHLKIYSWHAEGVQPALKMVPALPPPVPSAKHGKKPSVPHLSTQNVLGPPFCTCFAISQVPL